MDKNNYELPSLSLARKRSKGGVEHIEYQLDESYQNLGQGKKYHIITHGCQANQLDSETIAGLLNQMGFIMCSQREDADVIIINTCAVRQNAEEKVFGEIGALKRLKREKEELVIGLCGCMAQEEKTIETIIAKYRQVDLIFGTHNITSLPKLLKEVYTSSNRAVEVYSRQGDIYERVPVTRFQSHKAWVNIMYGCDKFCSYCIVPYTRGKERSRYLEDIVDEVETLIAEGYKEVTLLGQNVDAYGKDLDLGYDFADLLEKVASTGIKRLRFMTSHPWDFTEEMIQTIAANKNICPYIHLPVQSGNDEILKRMNRRYTIDQYKKLFDRLKEVLPHFAFTTDIIVGFPNESDEAFEDTLKIVDYCQFDNAFTFIYSPREGTPAALIKDEIPMSIKEQRLQKLNEKVAFYANMNNQKYLNQTVEVLVDGISKRNSHHYSGYTADNKLVNFKADNLNVGDLVYVRITEVMSFSLNGEVVL